MKEDTLESLRLEGVFLSIQFYLDESYIIR